MNTMYTNPNQVTSPYMYNYGAPQYQRQIMPTMPETLPQSQAQYPPPLITTPQQNYIKGRPVVSIDEARASQIDLDGSLYVFPDLGNKKIYTKQINLDGTASFNVFELSAPADTAPAPVYVTKDELEVILKQFRDSLPQIKTPEAKPAPLQNFNI